MEPVSPATAVPTDRLLELAHGLRRALRDRGENLSGEWVEQAANDLRSGELSGWALSRPPGGLALLSLHGARAVGHLHVEAGPGAVERGTVLLQALRGHEPAPALRTDVGVTGLAGEEERAVAAAFETEPAFSVLRRFRLERSTTDPPVGATLPPGLRRVPVREIPLALLAQLDWASFQGTADEAFVAEDVAADQRLLGDILSGKLGRFLDEGSAAMVDGSDQFVAAILTAEESPRSALFLDLIVHPAFRRKGVAHGLMGWGIRAAAALGYSTVTLWVTESNLPARALYERLSYRTVAETAIYRWSAPAAGTQPHSAR